MHIKYPNKDSFEGISIYNHSNDTIDKMYFLKGKPLSYENYCKLKYKFENVGFSSIKGNIETHYHTNKNKSICHERYILNDTISCQEEIKELIGVTC